MLPFTVRPTFVAWNVPQRRGFGGIKLMAG